MELILIAGLVLLGLGVAIVVRAAIQPRTTETVHQIGAYGFSGARQTLVEDRRSLRRGVDDLAGRAGDFIGRRLGPLREQTLRQRLISAGMYTTTPRKLVGYQLLLAIAMPIVWIWIGGLLGGEPWVLIVGAAVLAVIGWMGPLAYVDRTRRFRFEEIDRELPNLIDVLVVTVEAGVGFTGSMRVAAQRMRGPLAQELRLTLQEQNMGLSTQEALINMVGRADTPGMRMFVRAIVQGETLGVSIGQIMRNLAIEMRKRRKAYAEERAQKAPVKMLFPLIFLIFPAMFIVLLLPAVLQFGDALQGRS